MNPLNYTPIDDLIKEDSFKSQKSVLAVSKESEPVKIHEAVSSPETSEIEVQKSNKEQQSMEVRPDEIELDPELKNAGLQVVSSNNYPKYLNVKIPLSDDKVVQGLHAPLSSSLRWLATLAVYILQIAHIKLKTVHGKVVRVLRR